MIIFNILFFIIFLSAEVENDTNMYYGFEHVLKWTDKYPIVCPKSFFLQDYDYSIVIFKIDDFETNPVMFCITFR